MKAFEYATGSLLYVFHSDIFVCILLQPVSNLELQPEGVAYENIKQNKQTRELTAAQYQDLNLQTPENPGQYQELVKKPETSEKLVINEPEITYENTRMEGQNKGKPKNQSEQSQYEELNTGYDFKEEHAYCEVSLR